MRGEAAEKKIKELREELEQWEAESHSNAEKAQQSLRLLYEQASKDLQKRVNKIFDAYVDYAGIDEQSACELLSVQESSIKEQATPKPWQS
ncbi:MAG: hypothetical protein LKE53_04955 [Oscillospiraceae bacterium]|jgi:uncharacterized protein (DUF3084 family)|nr:hypothetical protein [Oscillospiraceae bacterium]MDD3261395.1 hypothetical protein [Oscillospiraceae bacterium]